MKICKWLDVWLLLVVVADSSYAPTMRVNVHNGILVILKFTKPQKTNVGILENVHFGRVVPSVLAFSNVSALQHELAQSALTDATANCLGEGTIEEHLMPNAFLAFGDAAQVQLRLQDFGVDANTHGR